MIRAAILALALAQTPEPTPPPSATPTPDPGRPPGFQDDDVGPAVNANAAPRDYSTDLDRGTVRLVAGKRNYSFHRVILPNGRPLVITGGNFTQARANTVVFWFRADAGLNAATGATLSRVIPGGGHTPVAADVGCRVVFRSAGWTQAPRHIVSQNGTSWLMSQPVALVDQTGGDWIIWCPVRDFTGITFSRCNLRNTWLPVAFPPIIDNSPRVQGDLP